MDRRRAFQTSRALLPLMALLIGLGLDGCALTGHLSDTPRLILHPTKGQITLRVRPGKPIGDIIPVDVAVANGTDEPYRIEADQVFAITLKGRKITPVPINGAITEMTKANALRAELTGAAKKAVVGGVAGAAAGAAVGAAIGTIVASPAQGALLGAAVGGGVGAAGGGIVGGMRGKTAARKDAETQIRALCLRTQEVTPNHSSNGYVFFPKGAYASVETDLLNEETEESTIRRSSWETGKALTPSAPTGFANSAGGITDQSLYLPKPQADPSESWKRTLPPTRIE
jgi:hypothetical protein